MRKLALLGGVAALIVLVSGRDGRRASAACPRPRVVAAEESVKASRPLPRGPRPALDETGTDTKDRDEERLYRITVVEGSSGEPIAGARLSLLGHEGGLTAIATSNTDGEIEVAMSGALPPHALITAGKLVPVDLSAKDWPAADSSIPQFVELHRFGTVQVRFPALTSDSNVRVFRNTTNLLGEAEEAISSGQGRWSISAPPGRSLIWATDETGTIAMAEVMVVAGQQHSVTLQRRQPSYFDLHIRDRAGRPLPVDIEVAPHGAIRPKLGTGSDRDSWWWTNDESKVRVPALPDKRFDVTLSVSGDVVATETVSAGENRTIIVNSPIVHCTLVDSAGRRVGFSTYSVMVERGDAGGIGLGMGGMSGGGFSEHRFVWPKAAARVEIELSTRDSRIGKIALTSAEQSCVAVAKPAPMVR